jgi:hypothetical protein
MALIPSAAFRCLPQDFPPLQVERNGTPQAQWYVFSPTVGGPAAYYTIITDSRGTPVWWINQSTIDTKVLGPDEIAWSPSDGTFAIRTFDGRLLNLLTGNLDFHDMQPTPSGTYLGFREVPEYVRRIAPICRRGEATRRRPSRTQRSSNSIKTATSCGAGEPVTTSH